MLQTFKLFSELRKKGKPKYKVAEFLVSLISSTSLGVHHRSLGRHDSQVPQQAGPAVPEESGGAAQTVQGEEQGYV